MTVLEAMEKVNSRYQASDRDIMRMELTRLECSIYKDLHLKTSEEFLDDSYELCVPAPFDYLYPEFLNAMIAQLHGDDVIYQSSIHLYKALLISYSESGLLK